ncbi:MAG: hypothetical protein JW709_02870 [Sedimentisphaerales bacterium]|nr:hypothetical protein [Sedimentisphaerales bacterium]
MASLSAVLKAASVLTQAVWVWVRVSACRQRLAEARMRLPERPASAWALPGYIHAIFLAP